MNGMIQMSVPRFVDNTFSRIQHRTEWSACSGDPLQQAVQVNPVADDPTTAMVDESELNWKGLAHIGLLGAYMDDLRNLGLGNLYVSHLNDSAENFIRMWKPRGALANE